ncbi:hypothetical protein [Sulfurimonas sp.]
MNDAVGSDIKEGRQYCVDVYNIEDITKKEFVESFVVYAGFKAEAIDEAHSKADKIWPDIRKMVSVREV